MRRTLKKILKYLLRTALVVILLLLIGLTGLYFYLNTGPGKRFLASEIGFYTGKVFGSEVSIGKAKWDFPATVSLENIVIKDHHHNNMFVIDKLHAGLIYFNYETSRMIFSGVTLKNVDFNLVRYPGDSSSNFGYVIDRLSKGSGSGTSHKTDIFFKDIDIENLHFKWNDQNTSSVSYGGIDWNHVDVTRFDGKFSSLKIDGNDVSANVKSIALNETCGFKITKMEGRAKYTPRNIEINDLDLITPYSRIRNHVRLEYANTDSMADFVNNVVMKADFANSRVSFKDLKYFTSELKDKTEEVNLVRLKATGKVNDLHISEIIASYGKFSTVNGRADMQGLPDINKTFFATRFTQLHTSREELEKFMPELELPDFLDKMGQINIKGYFNGFLNNFKTNTDFETALGKGKLDADMKLLSDQSLSTYTAKIELEKFDIGKLFDESRLGNITASGSIDGTGLSLESVQARLVADVDQFYFYKYNYQNVKVNGEVAKKFFKGSLIANDPNLTLDFKGSVDYRKKKPVYNFYAKIPNANLYALNFARDSLDISTNLSINIKGNKPDDIDGQVIARSTRLTIPGMMYNFDSMSLYSVVSPDNRMISLYSGVVQAEINGNFQVSRLADLVKAAARHYIDSGFYQFNNEYITGQYVNFDIKFIDLGPVLSILRTNFSVADSGFLKGSIHSDGNKLELSGNLPEVSYKDLHFKDLVFKGQGGNDGLDLGIKVGAFINRDTELVRDAVIKLKSNSEKLFFDIQGTDFLNQKQAYLAGSFDVVSNGQAYLDLASSSRIKILDDTWNISAQRIVFYRDTLVNIPELSFSKRNEKIKVSGEYSPHNSYPLRFIMENLDLATVGGFVPAISHYGGSVNGQIILSNLNAKPIMESALYISNAAYNGDTLGTLSAQTNYDESTSKLSIDTKLFNGKGDEVASAIGAVNIDQSHALALNLNLNQTDLKLFEPFINSVFSELKGQATAAMLISGTFKDPDISGNIDLSKAEFKVNYTNVKYHFTHRFTFSGRTIIIKDLDVYDPANNKAIVGGKFDLTNLNNFGLDLNIKANKFMALNTTQKNNALYFGKCFGTGTVSINGTLDNLKFAITMKSEKGTTFSMPISSGNTFYGYDYIKFINKSSYLKQTHEVKVSGIELTMNLDITPDAFGQIIFDPRVGDIIEAHGNGNLRLEINTDGDFNMYGTYTIADGKYKFTALNGLISKSFTINNGSTINWNGNPYEAQLNMQAIYTARTTLSALMIGATVLPSATDEAGRVFPVEALLNLKGSLFQPEIRLDFEVEELNQADPGTTDIETRINQIKGNQQDIDQQVVSLLVLNQFAPVDQGLLGTNQGVNDALNSTVYTSMGDIASSQINDLISKVRGFESLHVGLNVSNNPYSIYLSKAAQQDFSLELSKDILQKRAKISASYDFDYNNYNTQLAYKLNPDGSFQIKAFGRTNNNPIIDQNSSTQGVGISYRTEFDKISELFRKRSKKVKNN